MADPFDPMNIFDDRDFAHCYAWDKNRIIAFLLEVAVDPDTFGITTEQGKQDVEVLQVLITRLTDLADPTSLYSEPPPSQQVLRVADETGKLSLNPTEAIPWDANANSEPFYIIFDLLGCFLSLITSVPNEETSDAMAKRYFLPLLVLYAKWCFELRVSIKKTPNVVQVTWFESNGKLWPFFGASINGYAKPPDATAAREWEETVQKARWNYLSTAAMLPWGYITFEDSPKTRESADGISGTKYGNCGETYPFLYILRDPQVNSSYGIAAAIGGLFPQKDNDPRYATYNAAVGQAYWNSETVLWPPCDNCKSLLNEAGATLHNFELFKS